MQDHLLQQNSCKSALVLKTAQPPFTKEKIMEGNKDKVIYFLELFKCLGSNKL